MVILLFQWLKPKNLIHLWLHFSYHLHIKATSKFQQLYLQYRSIIQSLLITFTSLYYLGPHHQQLLPRIVYKHVCVCAQMLSHDQLFAVPWTVAGSSANRIFQARILEWGSISYSRGSSWLRDSGTQYFKARRRNFSPKEKFGHV